MSNPLKPEHLYFAVGAKKDFIVFNSEILTDDEITPEDIKIIHYACDPEVESIVWSSNCKFFFVVSDIGLALFSTNAHRGWLCRKKSFKFIELYLQSPLVKREAA